MAQVIWSRRAMNCVRRIGRHIEKDRPRTAAKWVRKLMSAPDILASLPKRGSVMEEFNLPHLRELLVRPYRILHQVENDTVIVLLVLHFKSEYLRLL